MTNTPLFKLLLQANSDLDSDGKFYFFRYFFNLTFDYCKLVLPYGAIDLLMDNLSVKELGIKEVLGRLTFFAGRATAIIDTYNTQEDVGKLIILLEQKLGELKKDYQEPYAEEIKKITEGQKRREK